MNSEVAQLWAVARNGLRCPWTLVNGTDVHFGRHRGKSSMEGSSNGRSVLLTGLRIEWSVRLQSYPSLRACAAHGTSVEARAVRLSVRVSAATAAKVMNGAN
jgi:hypothetical protein